MNQYESEAMARELLSSGWTVTRSDEQAEFCIVNTCAVTQKAAMQSRQAVRRAIRAYPGARIIVTGCYAQMQADEIKKINGVDDVIGHAAKHKIVNLFLSRKDSSIHDPLTICPDANGHHQFKQYPETAYGNRSRPFLKIQDGCDSFCTYCIVPFARGHSRSMPFEDVLKNISKLCKKGYHEVVLTGIHLGNYGLDLFPQTTIYKLLRRIHESHLIDRVRLSSIEPLELTDEIIELVADSPFLCRHFHIPLQSGDNRILERMNRPYTAALFKDRVLKIIEKLPGAAIGVDILIGFPGETDDHFNNTFNLIRALPIAYLHVFPYSARPGTAAFNFPDKVSSKTIKKRCLTMRTLGIEKKQTFYKKHIGSTLEVIIEETRDRNTGLLRGISSNYIPVVVDASDIFQNKIVNVRVEKLLAENLLYGNIILK